MVVLIFFAFFCRTQFALCLLVRVPEDETNKEVGREAECLSGKKMQDSWATMSVCSHQNLLHTAHETQQRAQTHNARTNRHTYTARLSY